MGWKYTSDKRYVFRGNWRRHDYAYEKEFGDTEFLLIIAKNKCNAMNDIKAKAESTPENSKCFFRRDEKCNFFAL